MIHIDTDRFNCLANKLAYMRVLLDMRQDVRSHADQLAMACGFMRQTDRFRAAAMVTQRR
jgi:hypothetical protein